MSTKGDIPLKPPSSSFSRPATAELPLNTLLSTSPSRTTSHSPVFASSLNPSVLNNKVPVQIESNPKIPTTSPTAATNFESRYLTKSPLRALTIDTGNETPTYDMVDGNRLGSYSATHNTAHEHVHTRNSLISSNSGNQSAKYSRAVESYRRLDQISPAKNSAVSKSSISSKSLALGSYPYTTTHQASSKGSWTMGNDYTSSILSSISPTSLHLRKMGNTKSYSQERHRVGVYGSFDTRAAQALDFRNRSLNISESSGNIKNKEDSSLHTIFSSLKASFSTPSQVTPNGKKNLVPLPNHEPTKCSVKRNGIVKAYAANTNQGIVRNYNEDRVSIILNIMKPASRSNEEWPKCSFFGVYDGHGGVGCADFLRDNLHQYVIKESSFPWNPKEALMKGFEAAEKAFLELAIGGPNKELDRSGSCGLVVLIVGEMCYVANVGDSRAVMSGDGGTKVYPLSKDHKPNEENEQKRIIEAGGKIYQSQGPAFKQAIAEGVSKDQMQLLLGPHRVFPGRLSVSRTFGDIEAKMTKLGGNPNVVIAIPEIKAFRISPEHDFILFATDGIFDKMSSRDTIKTVWASTEEKASNIHHQCGLGVESVLREAINRRTLDNITVVLICFKNFKQRLFPQEKSRKSESLEISQKDIDFNPVSNSLPTETANLSLETSNVKEEGILSQKARLFERINFREKALVHQKSVNLDTNKQGSPSYLAKRPLAGLREDSPDYYIFKKTNMKTRESVPISDVNLTSKNKRLIAKRGSEYQTPSGLSKSQVQATGNAQQQTSTEPKTVKPIKTTELLKSREK